MKQLIDQGRAAALAATLAATLALWICSPLSPALAQGQAGALVRSYEVVDLGALEPSGKSYAYGVNAAGVAVGAVAEAGQPPQGDGTAALFRRGQSPVLMNSLTRAAGYAINDLGEVLGQGRESDDVVLSFVWKDGVTTIVRAPPGGQIGLYGINNRSVAVGQNYIAQAGTGTAIRYENGVVTDLGNWGGNRAVATGINDEGVMTGYRYRYRPRQGYTIAQGVRVGTDGRVRTIDVFGSESVYPNAINARGDIAGTYTISEGSLGFAFVRGQAYPLALPGPTRPNAFAFDINDRGSVVGRSTASDDSDFGHAMLWEGGELIDLNSLPEVQAAGWDLLYEAVSINNDGVIVGSGIRQTGELHAFMLVPKR